MGEKAKLIEYDENLLKEDIKFPLKGDEFTYIWDADGKMVAMFEKRYDEMVTRVCGEFRIAETNTEAFELIKGDYYTKRGNKPIGLVRGWGRLQKKSSPEKRQDNIAAYLLSLMNEDRPVEVKDGKEPETTS